MSLLVDKVAQLLGVSRDRAEYLTREFVEHVLASTAGGAEVRVSGLGVFRQSEGVVAFDPESRLATVVNHRFAGLSPVPVESVTSGDRTQESAFAIPDIPIAVPPAAPGSYASETPTTPAADVHDDLERTEVDWSGFDEVRSDQAPPAMSADDATTDPSDETAAFDGPDADDYSVDSTGEPDWFGGHDLGGTDETVSEDTWSDPSGSTQSEGERESPTEKTDFPGSADTDMQEDYTSRTFSDDESWFNMDEDESDGSIEHGDAAGGLAIEPSETEDDDAETAAEDLGLPEPHSYAGQFDDPFAAASSLVADADELGEPEAATPDGLGDEPGELIGIDRPAVPPAEDSLHRADEADVAGKDESDESKLPVPDAPPVVIKRKSRTLYYLSLIVVLLLAIAGILYLLSLGDGSSSEPAPIAAESETGEQGAVEESLAEPPISWEPGAIDRRAGGYTLVVSSQKTIDEANAIALELSNRMSDEALPVDVLRGTARGEPWYRVAIGQFSRQSVANRELRRLADELPEGAWVLRIRTNM